MSNGEVKRWETISIDTKIPGTRFDVDDVPRVTVISADDHERVVAELRAEVEQVRKESEEMCNRVVFGFQLDRQKLNDELDIQKRVIEKLKVINRDFAWHYDECSSIVEDNAPCDCGLRKTRTEIATIEKGEA